jgi:hypothetical protein
MAVQDFTTNVSYEEFIANKTAIHVPTGHVAGDIGKYRLFDFQRAIVEWAIKRGKAAIFSDTGTGKTAMLLAWADQVVSHTGKPVIVLSPLGVAGQTVRESARISVDGVIYARSPGQIAGNRIVVTNYEMMEKFDPAIFGGVVLDESSILKSVGGSTKNAILSMFANTDYKLSCTATPSPNDYMELGNQSQFLGIMSATEMLATFFTHDGGNTSKWRLKGHGRTRFWEWMAHWAICIRTPDDLGFDGSAYTLPPLKLYQHTVESEFLPEGEMFQKVAQTLGERRDAKRNSMSDRVSMAIGIIKGDKTNDKTIIWCHLNAEQDALNSALKSSGISSVSICGATGIDDRIAMEIAWREGDVQVFVSKPSVFGFGMNWQHCARMIFVGLDDSYESYYQAIRRCHRFGQRRPVEVHLITSEAEGAIKENIERKSVQANEMSSAMISHMREFTRNEISGACASVDRYDRETKCSDRWELNLGDCIDVIKNIGSESIGYTIFSPPFSTLYTYSNCSRDMGNSRNHSEFYDHFKFLVSELLRVTASGRLLSFHCTNIPMMKSKDGEIGIHDFRGELIRMFVDAGWIFHSEVVIWKDPVTAMQRTKALGLLHKQLKKDSCMSRHGIPDYLVTMRKRGDNQSPVTHTGQSFPVSLWQHYASPVWMDINPSRTLQYRSARENDDERHICPLQLDVIERAIRLWSNPDDLVFSPFAGIGSELFVALQMGRKAVGIELKRSYYDLACRNLDSAIKNQGALFDTEEDHDAG